MKDATYYLIKETLEECSEEDILSSGVPYAAVVTSEKWKKDKDLFSMGIDLEFEAIYQTRAVVNYDSLTGCISIPDMGFDDHISGKFYFALDEKGIVFIDDQGLALDTVRAVAETRRWKMPGLERFLYDFLEQIISKDQIRLENVELMLENMEKEILEGEAEPVLSRLNKIRGDLLDMDLYYSRLLDLGQELYENENDFFGENELRYFHMFIVRVERLREMVSNHRDYSVQLRDLIQTRIDVKQNRVMTLLTVVSTIFMPLTLLTGWYGMNFKHMPELEFKWSYPAVMLISLGIAAACIIYFKKKKWL